MIKFLTITIWLLTCNAGEEAYCRYGHTAIRVQDTEQGWDVCFNYGTFSFDTDNFYYKFIKGETYYMLSVSPTDYFMEEYKQDHRPVYWQELNLNESQKEKLTNALIENCMPENAEYLYNFVYDNCATRPYRLLQTVLEDSIQSDYKGWEGTTFRKALRYYNHPHSIINGLINLIFGSRSDQPMSKDEALFLPEQLMFYIQEAKLQDGTPLVRNSYIRPFRIRKAEWWETIYPYLLLLFVSLLALSFHDRKRGKLTWGVDVLLATIMLILVGIVIFLRFFSIHPLVGFDWRLLIIPIIHLCARLPYILR